MNGKVEVNLHRAAEELNTALPGITLASEGWRMKRQLHLQSEHGAWASEACLRFYELFYANK